MRLGQAERAEHLAARQRLQPLLLLRLGRPGHQDRADRAVVDADDGRGGAVAGGDLLEDDGERQVVEAGAVVLGRHGHAVAAERGEALQFGLGEVRLAVPAGSVRRDLRLHVAAHRLLDGAMVVVEDHGAGQPSPFGRRSRSVPVPLSSSVSPDRASPSSRVIQPSRLSLRSTPIDGPAQVDVLVGVDRRAKADVEAHAHAGARPAVAAGLGEMGRGHRHEDAAELRARGDQAAIALRLRGGEVMVQRVEVVHRGRERADLVVAEAHPQREGLADRGRKLEDLAQRAPRTRAGRRARRRGPRRRH